MEPLTNEERIDDDEAGEQATTSETGIVTGPAPYDVVDDDDDWED